MYIEELLLSRPGLFVYDDLINKSNIENLDHAFRVASEKIGIDRLLDPEGKFKSQWKSFYGLDLLGSPLTLDKPITQLFQLWE